MLRIEIEDLITQLFNKQKEKRSEAKSKLLALEKEQEIVIEILLPHLEDDNIITKSYAIGALCRISCENKFQRIEEIFLKERDIMLLSVFFEHFLKEKQHSFEDCLLKKITQIESEFKKHKKKSKEEIKLLSFYHQLILDSLPYFQQFGSKKCHSLLYKLLEHKNPHIRYHALLGLSKIQGELTRSLLEKIIEKGGGIVTQLAKMLLDRMGKNE